jgi:hypothetical protein
VVAGRRLACIAAATAPLLLVAVFATASDVAAQAAGAATKPGAKKAPGAVRPDKAPATGAATSSAPTSSAPTSSATAGSATAGSATVGSAPAGEADRTYDRTIERALSEYRLGNWDEAAALFTQAHALKPSARTLRGLGLSEFENRKYVLALVHCSAALADTRNPLNAEQHAELQGVITRASEFVARVTVALAPPSAQLTVDGVPPYRDVAGNVLLDPGPHELVATDGALSERRRLEVLSGQQIALALTVRPEPNRIQLADSARAKDDDSVPAARILTYTGIAVLGVGLAVGTTTGVIVLDKAGELEDACDDKVCAPDQREELDQSKDLAVVSNVAFVVAGVGAAAAVAGLVWEHAGAARDARSNDERTEGEVRVSVSPFGAALSGRF